VEKAGLNIGLRLPQRAIVSAWPSEWFRTIGAHLVMAVLDTAIHAFASESRSRPRRHGRA